MFYVAKIVEAIGIVVIAVNFLVAFPELMNFRIFLFGGVIFLCGWAVERYGPRKQ